ncbi:MAG: hypothetical protein QNK23_15645 [Crocinitomicaceae bacterium]|nr:hypothetical protein [Crocinitomicaceae bacterium]
MKGTRFYKSIIALLVIINIGLIVFMWMGKPSHPPHPGEGPLLSEKIGLTGESKTSVDALEKQHHVDKKKLMQLDRELHQQMFDLVGAEEDPSEIQSQLNANKEEVERMTFDFFDDVASYCTPEQIDELHSFIEHRLIRMGPPPPPHE